MTGRALGVGPTEADLGLRAVLFRAVDVVRLVAATYAVIAFLTRAEPYADPAAAWVTLVVMAVWSVLVAVTRRRPTWLLVTDLLLATGAVLMTGVADDRVTAGATNTLPLIWPAAAVLSWAVWRGWPAGLLAAMLVGAADLAVIEPVTRRNLHNIFLVLVAGGTVGFAADLYERTRREAAAALQAAAAARERERLARDIHDSVLQVLAYVQRRGQEIGGPSAELGRLAGEQERLLRALISERPPQLSPAAAAGQPAGPVDLVGLLRVRCGTSAQVTGPAGAVPVPPQVAEAIDLAVQACLQNVARHAGPGVGTWVLVEDEPEAVTVTVRDDGVGFEPGRLARAEQEGRLGMARSIRGRIEDAGGSVEVWSAPGQGTEVELRVPRI